jgi:hypothetical protein
MAEPREVAASKFAEQFLKAEMAATEIAPIEAICHYCHTPVFLAQDTDRTPLCASCWERLTLALAKATRLGFHLGT